jgi:hypothetical protein
VVSFFFALLATGESTIVAIALPIAPTSALALAILNGSFGGISHGEEGKKGQEGEVGREEDGKEIQKVDEEKIKMSGDRRS